MSLRHSGAVFNIAPTNSSPQAHPNKTEQDIAIRQAKIWKHRIAYVRYLARNAPKRRDETMQYL
eukprot:10910049-Alexandrium_andersonii.AAC.1